jgi:hypothetical protein
MIIGRAGSRIQWAIRVEAFGAPICHHGKQVVEVLHSTPWAMVWVRRWGYGYNLSRNWCHMRHVLMLEIRRQRAIIANDNIITRDMYAPI